MNYTTRFIVLSILTIALVSCSSGGGGGSSQGPTPTMGTVTITSPSDGIVLPDTGTLQVSVFVDGDSTAAVTDSVDFLAATVELDVVVPEGSHTFRLTFEYTDPVYGGPFQLSYADSAVVDVAVGAHEHIAFTSVNHFYEDLDADGVTNLAELANYVRTDPSDSTCILDLTSVLDSCTLG